MSQNNLMMQIQADVLGIPVLRPSMTETTSLGAAIVGKNLKTKNCWVVIGKINFMDFNLRNQ